ncbi:hypothetical protein J421_5183 (plasmid) [Gemmatirosa kalamazoonensis]|uniref:DUF7790 domain-containing protein n=1 Tax=Gemmatirosa kalamazoonensis TaxID=861299 RepID=W0RT36_9BACT|nr:hypothetical protein [Gemmatirosa kalamazoonensis]AHG92718.1 hypothetical protein J421_5183 [Gemmatirosa kalamazoonensis]
MRSRSSLLLALLALAACRSAPAPVPAAPPTAAAAPASPDFARLVTELSEPGGYFDSDNLVTNETSYLHVVGALKRLGVQGGAYIGVGPDQNFSYVAAIRPSVAFMLDIRRDNMLEHLLFKALFARARNRAEYLALLTGRPVPTDVERWADRPLADLVAHFDTATSTPASEASARELVMDGVRRTGVPLDSSDLATIRRFHGAFIADGMQIRYESRGRPGRGFFPSLHDLLLARDVDGSEAGYLAREADYQFVKDLEARDRVIPVTGNLAGPKAVAAVGAWVRAQGEHVSALYTSNAEDYIMRDGSFPAFERNVAGLPRDAKSVIIRSYFGGFRGQHPFNVPGFRSTQLLQPIDAFAATVAKGGYGDYYLLVTDGAIDPRPPVNR